jgi:hypothetical protein
MSTLAKTSQISGIYETLGQLIQNPKSLGLRERLPPLVLAVLTSTREILREEMNGRTPIAGGENDLAAELSQDADTQHDSPEEEQNRMSFSWMLGRRMEQLHLSKYDVAVSLGCTLERVCDFITGVRAPTELHIAELALLLGVPQETLATAAERESGSLAAAV